MLLIATCIEVAAALFSMEAAVAGPDHDAGDRHLILRYDDYAPISVQTGQPRNIAADERLFELVARYHASIIVGVVPFPIAAGPSVELSPDVASPTRSWLSNEHNPWTTLLRDRTQSGTVEIALHGFEHRRRTPDGHRPGEFNGRPYFWQYDAIKAGNAAIHQALGASATLFIPPWNAWNDDTAHVLFIAGFTYLSPDLHVRPAHPAPLRLIPQSASDPRMALNWMQNEPSPPGTILVLVIHPFDLEGPSGNAYLAAVDHALAFTARSAEWRCSRTGDLPDEPMEAWALRYDRAVRFEHNRRILGDSMGGNLFTVSQNSMYLPAEGYADQLMAIRITAGAAIVLPVVIGALAAWIVSRSRVVGRRRSAFAALISTAALTVLIYGAIVVAQQGYLIRGLRWQAIGLAAGITLVFWISALRHSLQHRACIQNPGVGDIAATRRRPASTSSIAVEPSGTTVLTR